MPLPRQKRSKKKIKFFVLVSIIAAAFFISQRPDHPAEAQQAAPPPPPKPAYTAEVAWPTTAKSASVGVMGGGIVSAQNGDTPRPTASIAKVITALAILEKKPLQEDESGPLIPITEADEQLYRDYVAKNGTVVLVKAGVSLPQRDALEAILLPSSNNVADTTAIWAFGSLKKYRDYANSMLNHMGLHDTTVGIDASGLDPTTTSTANDLVRLGEIALKNPIIAQIVALPAAYVPFAGDVPNHNRLVTQYGYSGLKPGESVQAGNSLLYSVNETINGKPMTIIGAVMGTENYSETNAGVLQVMESVKQTLRSTN